MALDVASRSLESATRLAEEMGGTPYQLDDAIGRLTITDILITATSSPGTLLHKAMVDPIFNKRRGRPLFIVDIAVPRDVDEEISKIPGVYLYDMDALQRITSSARTRREEQIEICEERILQLIRSHSFDEYSKDTYGFSDDGSDPVTIV